MVTNGRDPCSMTTWLVWLTNVKRPILFHDPNDGRQRREPRLRSPDRRPRHADATVPDMPRWRGRRVVVAVVRCRRSALRLRAKTAAGARVSTSTLFVVRLDELRVDIDLLAGICARFGIARLDVFGSFATGEADSDSDIDLLYELAPGRRLGWEIEELSEELEAALGRPVDLIAGRSLHPRLRDTVLAEARPLYAA